MAREEQFLGYAYSCGGGGDGSGSGGSNGGGDDGGGSAGRVSKKVKQKKVPQRGLGVAQLEKIRLEEQQKMEASNVLGRSDLAAFLPIPCPKFTSAGISDVIGAENLGHQLSGSGSGGEMESKAFSGPWPRLWSGEYSFVGEKQRLDHGFRCEASVDANFAEAVPVLPPLVLPRRSSCQFQRPPPSPPHLMVNTSPGIIRSSVARSQMEPPSNQSSRDNYAPSWLGEEKMVGTKRSYPFSFESPQASPPLLHRNLSSGCVVPVSCRSDELSLSSDGSRAQSEPRNKCIREGPLSLSPLSKWSPGEVSRENAKLGGEFLTLAPPSVSLPSNSMHKRRVEYSEFESFAIQESVKAQTHQSGPSGSVEQPFSFFPIKYQVEKSTLSCLSNGNDGKGETIDLNLKL